MHRRLLQLVITWQAMATDPWLWSKVLGYLPVSFLLIDYAHTYTRELNSWPPARGGKTQPPHQYFVAGIYQFIHIYKHRLRCCDQTNCVQECSISPKDEDSSGISNNICPYPFLEMINSTLDEEEDEDGRDESREMATLPLFPMHGEEEYNFTSSSRGHFYGGWYPSDSFAGSSARASLELSLNSGGTS